jgi:mono/diheme cytochrome c family protein
VELAEAIGRKLDAPVEFVWWLTFNQRRALRNTILANNCDAVIALPAADDYRVRGVRKSKPFLDVSYAVVAAPSLRFSSLDDFRGKRVGVQFGTTPHLLLNSLEGLPSVTYRDSDEIFAALAKGEIDAGFLWGPQAGWDNRKRHAGRWAVTPVAGHDLAGQVVIGVRNDKAVLAEAIDRALAELKPQIDALADKYAFPRARPVNLALASAVVVPAVVPVVVPMAQVVRVVDAAPSGDDAVQAGRTRFNSQCSHCHGSDAVSPLRERDLRRLKLRYDDKWREVALTTIVNGRSDKGMPTWRDAFKDSEIQEVMSFLGTVQK